MNLKEVNRVLQETFNKELKYGKKRHIVFWYDEEGEFLEDINELELNQVRIWKLTPNNLFATKYELEKVDLHSHFLIYANMSKPLPREDWLLDIYKYSYEFATDKVTVIMRDLGITNDSLRPVFKRYAKFFNNKERYAMFNSYQIAYETEEQIDIAVLATLCKCSLCNLDNVIKTLFREHTSDTQKSWANIQKFGDEEVFWGLVEKYYGFSLQDKTIETLAVFFMFTHLAESLTINIPTTWLKYISKRPANCIVLMDQFMHHSNDQLAYNRLADKIGAAVKIDQYIKDWEVNDYIKSETFRVFDENIIQSISNQLLNEIHQYDAYIELIGGRRALHWYSEFQNEYDAVYHAVLLFKKVNELDYFIRQQSPYEMFKTYTEDYYVIDTAYRKFYTAFDQLENKDRLMLLKEKVENLYVNWYLDELSIKWSDSIEEELKEHWLIPSLEHQQQFFGSFVQPFIDKGERLFVIVSDALRFEAAKELCNLLNNERKASTEIIAMQGNIPSYTDLGMASVLPRKELVIVEKENGKAEVHIDQLKASNTENRSKVLLEYCEDSVAIQYKELIEMNRQSFRENLAGKKIVYIYHNSIDARGDHSVTEREVFNAVEDAFKEIRWLVNQLVNSVSASNIIITADHGFIYSRDALHASDKVTKNIEQADIEKRRFIISNNDLSLEGTMNFSMDYILGKGSGKYAVVPRGANRFAVQGAGANYVHGGAMLQEVVIPVIKFKNDRSKLSKNEVRKVEVKLTSITRKVTNMITYLEFFQTEKTEGKVKPLRIKTYFVDDEGNRISNENIIIADSQSSKPEERSFKEKFVFKSMIYNKATKYYLIVEDEEETFETIYDKIPFTIDIAISNDFGF